MHEIIGKLTVESHVVEVNIMFLFIFLQQLACLLSRFYFWVEAKNGCICNGQFDIIWGRHGYLSSLYAG